MSNLAVANQYAKALLETVSQPGRGSNAEQALSELDLFNELLKSSRELRTALLSPAVSFTQKQRVILQLGGMLGLGADMKSFLSVVTRHRRLNLLPAIRTRYEALLDETLGLVRAAVSTAQPLGANGRAAIAAALAQVTGREVRCDYEVDGALVGGVAVRVGSTMYDGSVRGQLNSLRRRLSE